MAARVEIAAPETDRSLHDAQSRHVDEQYYEVVQPGSLAERIFCYARRRIYEDFLKICQPRPENTILDVGVSDVIGGGANILEQLYPHPERIIAAGLGSAAEFHARFPQIRYRQIAAQQALPFINAAFDIVLCNAVLEHVGSIPNQMAFLQELARVGKRLFLTVPNRLFPVEHHTAIPLLHWSDATFPWACRMLRKEKWVDPANLILISRRHLEGLCPPGMRRHTGSAGIRLGPFSSNLYLFAERSADSPGLKSDRQA
jgi:SAM-dependent methyltransferase